MRFFLLILFLCVPFKHPATAQSLRDKPESDLETILGEMLKIRKNYPVSILAETQIELWLNLLPFDELITLEKNLPTPWEATDLSRLAQESGIRQKLSNLTQKTTAEGFKDGTADWSKEALNNVEIRSSCLLVWASSSSKP